MASLAPNKNVMPFPVFDPILLPRLIIWTLVFGVLTITGADPDLWGHVRFGLDIIRDMALTAIDPYSFTSDREWINHEWLSEAIMGFAYTAGGAFGLASLKVLVLGTGFVLLARDLKAQGLPPIPRDLWLVVAVMGCLYLTKSVRPQMFSIMLFISLVVSLRRAERDRRYLFAIPVIFAPWANLHGGWLVGGAVLALWTAVRVVAPVGASRTAWLVAGASSVPATLLTPYGTDLWVFLWQTVGLGRADITEWQPVTTLEWGSMALWTIPVVVLAVAAVRRVTIPPTHLIATVLLTVLSFKVLRLVPFAAVTAVGLVGPLLHRAPASKAAPPATGPLALAILAAFVLAAVVVGGEVGRRNLSCLRSRLPWAADADAARFILHAGLSGRMATYFDWGEYAVWHLPGIRVSMDGRRETVYSDAVLNLHSTIYFGRPGWETALNQLNPDFIWLPTTIPVVNQLPSLGWKLAFRTARSAVFTRTPVSMPPPAAVSQPDACFPA